MRIRDPHREVVLGRLPFSECPHRLALVVQDVGILAGGGIDGHTAVCRLQYGHGIAVIVHKRIGQLRLVQRVDIIAIGLAVAVMPP